METISSSEPSSAITCGFENWNNYLFRTQLRYNQLFEKLKTETNSSFEPNSGTSSFFKSWNNYCKYFEPNQAIVAVSKPEIITVVVSNLPRQ